MRRSSLLAAIAILGLGGCSFLAVRGPQSPRAEGDAPSCHISHGAAVADGLLAIASLAIAAGADDGGGTVGSGLVGVLAGSSMLYGVSRNGRCQRELNAYEVELEAEEQEAGRHGTWAGAVDAATKKPPAAAARPPAPPPPRLPVPQVSFAPPAAPPAVRKPDEATEVASGEPTEDDGEAGAADDAASAEPDEEPGAADRAFHVAADGSRPSPPPADDDDDDDDGAARATPEDPEERWHAFWRRLK